MAASKNISSDVMTMQMIRVLAISDLKILIVNIKTEIEPRVD